jgi:hypothetical protein
MTQGDAAQNAPGQRSSRLKEPLMVRVTAADFNGQAFDGFPFSDRPAWLLDAIRDLSIAVAAEVGDTDYAIWNVKTQQGIVRALPGDMIAWWGDCMTVIAYPEKRRDSARDVRVTVDPAALSGAAKETIMQLFVSGPTWDGNLSSKMGRTELVDLGLAFRTDGWQSLTPAGLCLAATMDVSGWNDKRWHRKQMSL